MKFSALDVDTFKSDLGSIYQIGWVEFEVDKIVDMIETLVNPNTPFLHRNITIHGIKD